ncbi:type II toxin-antitoxin system VapC family toxin [Arcicella aquatica]|uniref:Type II toxin-antitoxin system VapC family toxin n=1 Tax=Arcicella aquatica TaxID=217141 RepID=A0ABU5QNX7_9BACT|nr:type II toxin-antitoxin system VapC family toxin [Arcicella aquatica]MEA5258782.1 type II toxin-antitoxin system VapC family toxin [Arcicella aquatica]
MEYLIDTQILIWYLEDDRRLSPKILEILSKRENIIWVSQISFFEIAIKKTLGKFETFTVSIEYLLNQVKMDGFQILNLKNTHITSYKDIPLLANHKDPFDRLLLATSLSEKITIISADEKFKNYTSIINLIEA